MTPGKKKESWLGILLTAVLCLGFLYWWFKPKPAEWQHESAAQLVERAASEPASADAAERLVLDLDYMEVAIILARQNLFSGAEDTVKNIADPAIQAEAAKQLANSILGAENTDLGRALRAAELVQDPAGRAAVHSTVLEWLAGRDFPDASLPAAVTPLQKAQLARVLAPNPAQRSKARELIAAVEAALAGLSPAEAGAVKEELAWACSNLTLSDGPAKAITAILALPPEKQPALWDDLTGWCEGLEEQAKATAMPQVLAAIPDPALRLKLETDSLLSGFPLKSPEELTSQCRAAVAAATTPEEKHRALLALARVQTNSAKPSQQAASAAPTLHEARANAAAITPPAARVQALIEIARRYSDSLFLAEPIAVLTDATAAARTIEDPAARALMLLETATAWKNQSREADKQSLIAEATAITENGVTDAAALSAAATALISTGEWPRAMRLITRITGPAARHAALSAAAREAGEESVSLSFGDPPPRGEPVDGIRKAAAGNEFKAAALVEAQPAGYAKARAWLAMAKGLNAAPATLDDYQKAGAQPADEPAAPAADAPALPR